MSGHPHLQHRRFSHIRLFVLCLGAAAFVGCERAPYSSPTALRDTNDYFKAISPPLPRPLDLQALDQISLIFDGETIAATVPYDWNSRGDGDGFQHAVDHLSLGQWLSGDGASIGPIAYAASVPAKSRDEAVVLEYFAPDGKPLGVTALSELGLKKLDWVEYDKFSKRGIGEAFPKLRIVLGSTKQPPGFFRPVGLFDASTKRPLVSSWGMSSWEYAQIRTNAPGDLTTRVRACHGTPLELVLDVELGGKLVVETNLTPDMRVAMPGGEVRFLGLWGGALYSRGISHGRAPKDSETIRFVLRGAGQGTGALALFVTEPRGLAVHIDLLNGNGAVLGSGADGFCGVRDVRARSRAEDVRAVRLTVFTNHHHAVYTLPPIPNLLPENRAVGNLFDVKIPFVRVGDDYEFRQVIQEATLMEFSYVDWQNGLPKNLLPMVRTNVTAGQLLMEYRRNLTNTCAVVVDEKKNEIRIEPTQAEKIKRWLRQKLRF
ncbi:MAG: hypothetical protein RLY20_3108 [Verrucomicrobiota bacterium]|jgi:hypothetical protein